MIENTNVILNRHFIDYINYLFYYKIILSINTIKILLNMLLKKQKNVKTVRMIL